MFFSAIVELIEPLSKRKEEYIQRYVLLLDQCCSYKYSSTVAPQKQLDDIGVGMGGMGDLGDGCEEFQAVLASSCLTNMFQLSAHEDQD